MFTENQASPILMNTLKKEKKEKTQREHEVFDEDKEKG